MSSIDRYYRSCDPDAFLPPGDPRYVDLTAARGDVGGGWRTRLARDLRKVDLASVFLVSGFLGDGKSTELRRMANDLKQNETKLASIYVDCSDFLNPIEYTFNEFLLGIISETGKQLRNVYGIELRPGYLSRKLDEVKKLFFSDVELQEIGGGAEIGGFELAGKIALRARDSDHVRKQLDKLLAGDRTTLNQAFADAINEEARPALEAKGYKDLVIIADWLEKLENLPPTEGRPVCGHEALFLAHAQLIRGWGAQVVMTVPIEMVYSKEQERLRQAYGCEPIVINQVGVVDFVPAVLKTKAMDAMRQVLRLRAQEAPDGTVSFDDVFESPEVMDELIHFSGGHLRTLMILIRQCCSFTDTLPITADIWSHAKRNHLLNTARGMKDTWYPKLVEVDRTHEIIADEDHFDMLSALRILAYANGVPLYGVEPVICELPKFQRLRDAADES